MNRTIEQILKDNKLSITVGRKKILELFLKTDNALVHAEIEKECYDISDRITVYRTLQSFLKKGLIHLIPTTDSSIKYALTRDDGAPNQHLSNHVHFICNNCNKTYCLSSSPIPRITLPKGYKEELCQLVITGICSNCDKNSIGT